MNEQPQRCAREGCQSPAYMSNALCLDSSIGLLVVHVCREHFAMFVQRQITRQTEDRPLVVESTREEPTP